MLEPGVIRLDEHFAVSFQRTLRVPDDGTRYPLPPGLGTFPLYAVAAFAQRVPAAWQHDDAVFMPMYQGEALWLGLRGVAWQPRAIKVAVGGFNVLTGAKHDLRLHDDSQDYLVAPPQVWIDGVRTQSGTVRQFVATKLGQGHTVEAALSGVELQGGLTLTVFWPRPGRFPSEPPPPAEIRRPMRSMGFAAGGEIAQRIYPDPFGIDTWDLESARTLHIYVLNSKHFQMATGQAPPPSPISAQTYIEHGFPWFELYDDHLGDLPASSRLSGVRTLAQHLEDAGQNDQSGAPLDDKSSENFELRREKPPK